MYYHKLYVQVQVPEAAPLAGTVGICRRIVNQQVRQVSILNLIETSFEINLIVFVSKISLTGYITGDMYSRQQSGPGGPATPNAPPNMSSSNANSKPGSDYSNYAYSSYNADAAYGPPPRSYSSDAGSQVGGYSSQPPNAGAKHFNDFKEWPTS